MDQNASAALIASIVAVVLGALGLVGGVIGYVQGTAALRRATLIRQRAAAAEEAALQARTQAEQAARAAQGVLDRLNGLQVRSLGDVAGLPTGPLILPSRVTAPTADGAVPALATGTRAPQGAFSTLSAPPAAAASSGTDPAPAAEPLVHDAYFATEDPRTEREPEREVDDEPEAEPELTSDSEADRGPDLERDPEPEGAPEPRPDSQPQPQPEPEPEPDPELAPERHPEPEVAPKPKPEPEPAPALGREPAPAVVGRPEPDSSADEPEGLGSGRSATGQVTAGAQEAPPMDWAEVLRTGAIPLPSRSRGTYAAPAKKPTGSDPAAPRFEVRAVGRQKYEAINIGDATAEQAVVEGAGDDRHLVSPVETGAKPVQPGESLAFSVLRVEGREVAVHVSWLAAGSAQQVELSLP